LNHSKLLNKIKIKANCYDYENFYILCGPSKILIVEIYGNISLKQYVGKTLDVIATMRQQPPEQALLDLIVENSGKIIEAIYFFSVMENVTYNAQLPWLSFCSDAQAFAPEGFYAEQKNHPRAFGNFARLLGSFVRDKKLITMQEAIRRLTYLPATSLHIDGRGLLKFNYSADVVVFNASSIQDFATYEQPQILSQGVVHVFVNGAQVVKNGNITQIRPGRVVRGRGWKRLPGRKT